jgi:hypothetical protein
MDQEVSLHHQDQDIKKKNAKEWMGYVLTYMKTSKKLSLTSPFHFTIKDNTKDHETITHDSNYEYHHSYNTLGIAQHL